MAALHAAPPRTPSPKIRIHRSQSFDYSPSSKSIRSTTSVTPIDDSPYSKSTSAIPFAGTLTTMNDLRHRSIMLNKGLNISDESMSSGVTSDEEMSLYEEPESPTLSIMSRESEHSANLSPSSSPQRNVQRHESPAILPSPHNTLQITHLSPPRPSRHSHTHTHSRQSSIQSVQSVGPEPSPVPVSPYQDPATPMLDPWLVRMVLDMYDVRGFDWMMIAEPLQRCWGVRTTSAEVLGILAGNGRVRGRVWWD